jgi:DNA-binding NarL/FixJ family response regulator
MLPLQKSIIIGCDDTFVLSAVLNNIRETHHFKHSIVSAARSSDLLGIVKSLNPDLVILCFRNNQVVLNDFGSFIKKPELPIICLSPGSEGERLRWNSNCIVFSYAMEYIKQENYLSSRIHSVFLLGSETAKKSEEKTMSLADAAMRQKNSGEPRDLGRYVMELDQKLEMLLKVKERIADLFPRVDDSTRGELMSIVNSIKSSANDNKIWDDFKLYFETANPGFLMLLANRHPELTPKDLKYCCYLKMNMSNDDIRSLLGINQESVRTHKYRLKKKMDLSPGQDLLNYLRTMDQDFSGIKNRDDFKFSG